MRSQEKADKIKEAYPDTPTSKLDFAIVGDIAKEGAFDEAVISEPPFEVSPDSIIIVVFGIWILLFRNVEACKLCELAVDKRA